MAEIDRLMGLVGNVAFKAPVRVATTASLGANMAGLPVIDGVQLVAGDRVLRKNETDPTLNGIWNADTGTWIRTQDMDGAFDIDQGTLVLVTQGNTNGNQVFELTTSAPVIGSTALTFIVGLFSGLGNTSFLQGGAGAVARPAQDKMREVVSSADFNNTRGTNSVGLGTSANLTQTGGDQNTALGYQALKSNVNSNYNTAIGGNALPLATGGHNTAVGQNSMGSTTTATDNVALGIDSLATNQVGIANTAIGAEALFSATASSNTAVGNASLRLLQAGQNNVAIGDQCLAVATSGNANTGVGQSAGVAVSTGQQNTLIGKSAGSTLTTGSNVTCVGNNAQPSSAAASNEMVFGDANVTLTRHHGQMVNGGNPAFSAIPSAQLPNVTGDNTVYTVVFATEQFDQAGNFDAVSTFTAPVTGKYRFSTTLFLSALGAAHTQAIVVIRNNTAGFAQTVAQCNPGAIRDSGNNAAIGGTCVLSLAQNDTVLVRLTIAGSTKTVNVETASVFAGELIC